MSEVTDWFTSLPIFTRCWLGLSVLLSLLGKIGLFKWGQLILLFQELVYNFQIWRPVTALFYYPITPSTGFHFLINCYFIYTYSVRLETGHYAGKPADYLFLLVFNWICCVIVALIAEIPILMDCMVMSVLYVWCQLNKDVIVSFWFGTRFRAMFLPFVLCAFNMIISGGGMMELVGILVGHLYFFLMFKYPQELGGQQLISTPSIFYQWFPSERVMGGFGTVPLRRAGDPVQGGGHRWGRGNVLGGQ